VNSDWEATKAVKVCRSAVQLHNFLFHRMADPSVGQRDSRIWKLTPGIALAFAFLTESFFPMESRAHWLGDLVHKT